MRIFFIALISLLSLTAMSQDTLKIMYYNLLNFPGTTPERADTLRKIMHYSLPDILVVNELRSEEAAELILQESLNQWSIHHYKRAVFTDGNDSDNMLFYDSTKVMLYQQHEIETELRLINEYILYTLPIVSDTVFLNVYSAHLKASSGSTEQNKRWEEVQAFKNHLADKQELSNIIFGGDLNIYKSSEKAYEEIISGRDIMLYDPIFSAGNWHNNQSYASIHTQSTRSAQFGGGASGGMDDRFDMIFVSEDLLNGSNRLEYIEESYSALGQDGLRFNQSMLSPANSTIPDSICSALYYMSDHLPVMMSIEVLDSASGILAFSRLENQISYQILAHQLNIDHRCSSLNIQIFDVLGRPVYQQSIGKGSQSIPLPPQIANGFYLIQFVDINSQARMTKKHFIQ